MMILRGVPGAGKSTWATRNFPEAVVCSADHFFVDATGVYRFNPRLLGEAHGSCARRCIESMQAGAPVIVVDNTATTTMEVSPYVLLAQAFGYEAEVVTFLVDPAKAAARNTHGVPEVSVHAMDARLRSAELMPWWPQQVIEG